MTSSNHNLTPRERLASIVAEETNGGRRVVRFFVSVTEGKLEEFKPNHRMDAAKELVKIGLAEFEDYIAANPSPPKRRKSRRKAQDISPEVEQAREELAQYARELTDDGRTVIKLYSEIMDGFRNDERFKPHHRIAAGRELLLRGFGPVSAWTQPEPAAERQSQSEPQIVVQCDHSLPEPLMDYLEEAVRAYEGPNPITEKMSPELREIIESDEPLDCQCADDYGDSCPDNDDCPYFHLEFPEYTEEERQRQREWSRRALRKRAEWLNAMRSHPERDP